MFLQAGSLAPGVAQPTTQSLIEALRRNLKSSGSGCGGLRKEPLKAQAIDRQEPRLT